MVLLRKSIPQNHNLKIAAELGFIKEKMNKRQISLGILLVVAGFLTGFWIGWKQSAERVSKNVSEMFLSTNAYSYSIGLTNEIGMHEFIKSGQINAAENFSLYKIDSTIKLIEKINYSNSSFKFEIDTSLNKAKMYLKEHPFVPVVELPK